MTIATTATDTRPTESPRAVTAVATAAALLLAVPVAVEAFWLHSGDDPAGDLLFAATQVAGWLIVLTVVRGLLRVGRRGRVLPLLVVAGVCLQAAFGMVYGLTTLASGEPLEASFVLFLLGFLLLAVGGVGWGLRLRRGALRTAGYGLVGVGALGFLAVAVGASPWHDLMLLGSYAAWVVVGAGRAAGLVEGVDEVRLVEQVGVAATDAAGALQPQAGTGEQDRGH